MSNEIEIVVTGNLARAPHRVVAGETALAEMRIGSTSRYFHRGQQAFVDAPTSWFTVKAWGELGENIISSAFDRGDPVIVRGELRTEEWTTDDGEARSKQTIYATAVGPDLNRGTANFTRTIRQSAASDSGSQSGSEQITATAARLAGAPAGAGAGPAADLAPSPHSAAGVEDSQWETEPEPAGAA